VTTDSVLTWVAVAAAVVGGLILLMFFLDAFRNVGTWSIVLKKHEDTYSDQG
jgi:hypothetical protein